MGITNSKSATKSSSELASAVLKLKSSQELTSSSESDNAQVQTMKVPQLRIVENFIVVWLDPNINVSNEDCANSIAQLRQIVNLIKTFTDPDQCVDFLLEVKVEKIFLIVSDSFGQYIIPLIEQITELDSIYVFCGDKSNHEQWAEKYSKVRGVFTRIELICQELIQDIRQSNNHLSPISIVSASSAASLSELDPSFMYSQLLKENLIDINYDDNSKKDLAKFCRLQYSGNQSELNVIDEFERDYYSHSPIWWYTRECFIYSMLNKALRIVDIEIIMKMGFFIRDLHQEIQQLHSKSNYTDSFIVYRGQGMLNVEFDRMKESNGGLLSFNNFLSTSTRRSVSLTFARRAREKKEMTAILFQIKIDPSISSTPVASLDGISFYRTEKEFLFSMHSIFRIGDMKLIDDELWEINLTLTSDNDQQLQHLTDQMRVEIEGPTGLHRLASLMIKMGEFDRAEESYKKLLETTSNDDRELLAHIHHQLGFINWEKGNLMGALSRYQHSIRIYLTYLPSNDSQLALTYSNIGLVLHRQGDLDGALKQYQLALNADLTASQPKQLKTATYYNNIGLVLKDQGKFAEALQNYQCSLEIKYIHLPPHHPTLATTYNNIGGVLLAMKEYSKAISYFQMTLEIQQKSLPQNHPSLATTHCNIAVAFDSIHQYKEAIKHAERSVAIDRLIFGSSHDKVRKRQEFLDQLKRKM
ncbi:unnamed protein product [Rotaria sp. Silwood2]|nr:unnamed protein product [Rotaria sp. Silwood2]CAF4194407.1 unnamed protein product [Rotaria sp. Silwood2]